MILKIITGLSGSGKTTALRAFEDMGYYAMDNVPAYLIEKFIELNANQENPIEKMAVVIDFRSYALDDDLYESFLRLKKANIDTEIIYIYSSDEVIFTRYNELRRPHPMGEYGNVSEGIEKEKDMLKPIRKIADRFIDTSNYKIAELKRVIEDSALKKDKIIINLISFGFKYGLSDNFEFVFDMRFLPNPYYIKDLKKLNGTCKDLQDYLDSFEISKKFEDDLYRMIKNLVPEFLNQGKDIINIAIGCTGGQHRSVYMVEKLYERMKDDDYILVKKHREKDRW
ncbi:MAG: RNase adapter RapZ [Anaerococcus sp.]|uniref:RNase adapter RapZ n=1 Tax=Anaerococcus sp. TaxID=1872515 RepID=UPI0026150208|nr:RNase adapter RapZ [Anaerococcus sp.]MCI5971526.1 RNase adapter RapZ [Anaerococcus sp.]MDD6919258.1 RNase adapter RapZ [Peptoniphilaceae bacterium]MDY2927909.1 RNase adapter RapZ [Anaerococcus sp.]